MAKVTLTNVSKIYRGEKGSDLTALKGLSLEIRDREFIVLTGPRGCGKSSALRMVAGLEEISKGDIFIGERQVNDLPAKNRDVAMIFENDSLYPQMTVYDNVAFPLELRKFGQAEIKNRVRDTASILGIGELFERKPGALSLAQRQRVAAARAIVRQPKIFLFDEPLANLDPVSRAELRAEMTKLHQRLEATVIYATEDPLEAMTMADRIVVLNKGVVQQTDTPFALYDYPANSFVAGFLGSPPINFLRGDLKQQRNALLFWEANGGTIEVSLPMAERPGAGEFIGKPVLLGIRPEDIELAEFARWKQDSTVIFPAIAGLVEPMGAETILHLETGAHTMLCRSQCALDRREVGHRLQVKMNVKKVHLFDPVTTKRIV
ncbi:MAG: ATP-binding cassette domain-containing protein [Verrucomicrobiota bacterium]|nr:ATP-binding cassette domain-containing protein [Verrucomicrobiota bacterium]